MSQYLAIDAVVESSRPAMSWPMQWFMNTLAMVASVLASASANWVFWNSITALPKAWRSLT